ncbi:hypothetical protein N7530_012699 [Penicillium desertorum]|uniref:Protein kinase domain-containing protein n=1 Tax=Penicillium desertorum TaxID=1303715 RepID=A0A9X0BFL6_9EURO|nr:hypothetical protein N7530_012699 [Penicillium desertorum]
MVLWSDKKSVANESTFEQPNEKLGYRLGILIILSESSDSLAAVKMESPNTHAFRRLQSVTHQNLVCLIEGFQSGGKFYIVYEYHHLAISLSCVVTNVGFSEADIATICNEILRGVIFIHYELKTSCRLLDCSNILLVSKGETKIGECLMKRKSRDGIKGDIEAIRSIMTSLSDLSTHLGDPNPSVEKANTSNSVEDQVKVSFIIKPKT